MASAIRLSIVCATVFGGTTTPDGGVQSLPSEYEGRTPRTGPPPPTSGPVPPSSVGFAALGTGDGIVVGIDFGATTWMARDFSARPSPPTRPTVGFAPGCANLTKPIRS